MRCECFNSAIKLGRKSPKVRFFLPLLLLFLQVKAGEAEFKPSNF